MLKVLSFLCNKNTRKRYKGSTPRSINFKRNAEVWIGFSRKIHVWFRGTDVSFYFLELTFKLAMNATSSSGDEGTFLTIFLSGHSIFISYKLITRVWTRTDVFPSFFLLIILSVESMWKPLIIYFPLENPADWFDGSEVTLMASCEWIVQIITNI